MKRNIILLSFFNFFTDFKFYTAVLIIYFATVTGSYFLAMSLFAATMVAGAFFEVPTGIFSDKIGRKNTIVLGALSAVAYTALYALGHSYSLLFFGAVIEGLSRAWYSGNNDAFLHDSLRAENKHHMYDEFLGKVSSMFQLALLIAAVLGGVIATFSFSVVMWLSVIPQILCFILSLFMKEPPVERKESANIFSHLHLSALTLLKNKKLRVLSLNSVIGYGFGESMFNFRAAFVNTLWPIWAIGFSNVLSYAGAAISYWFSGKVIRKFGALRIMIVGQVYGRLVGIVSVIFPTVFSPALMATTSLFYGVKGVAESKLMQQEYTNEQRATIDSLNSLFGSLFYGVCALFLGYIGDSFGPAKALLVGQIILLPLVVLYRKLYKTN